MALHNDPRMYSEGAVVFDTQPIVNLYGQLMAKREAQNKAKDDAFQEYVRSLNTKINAAGHRVVDNPVFADKLQQWQQFGMKNKDKLTKNDINTRTEFDRQYQELLNITQESKAEEEKKKPFVEMLLDPAKRDRLSSNVIPAVASHDEALYVKNKSGEWERNQNRKSLDYTSNLFDPKFDFTKGFEGWSKGMDRGEVIGDVLRKDPVTGRAIVATTKAYTPEQIQQIGLNAARSVTDTPDNHNYYQHKFEKLGEDEYAKLNDAFQSVYGKQVEVKMPNGQKTKINNYIDSPEEVAAAEAIIQAKALTEKGEKAALDWEVRNQASINKIYIQDKLIRGRKSIGDEGVNFGDYDILGKYEGNAKDKKVRTGGTIFKPEYETIKIIPAQDVDKTHKEMIGVSPITDEKDGSRYYIRRANGDWEGSNGQVISATVIAQKELDKVNLNELRRGRQNLKLDNTGGSNDKPKGNAYLYNNKPITLDQIKKGAAKYKMTIEQYIQSTGITQQ